jgi:hypothetical protein
MKAKCDRCGKDNGGISIMSYFNTDEICMECDEKEREHPKFREALEADQKAVRAGNFNFPGIGKPADL